MSFSFPQVMGFITGALQFAVAGYALRLNRIFGTARVGWSLFWAFALLALLHLFQSISSFNSGEPLGVEIEVMYSLISLLLLTGMVHIETLLKERLRLERAERRLRAELESEVKKKTAYLTRALEELQLEIDGRKRVEAEVEKTHKELLTASRQAGMVEIAAGVLRNVGNILKNADVSASLVSDQVKQSKITNVVHVGALIREHVKDLGDFMARDPRGQKLPVYIADLADYLANEQITLSRELASLKKTIEEAEAEHQIQKDGRNGKRRDDRGLAAPETGRRIPGLAGRRLLTQFWPLPLGGRMLQSGRHRGWFRRERVGFHGSICLCASRLRTRLTDLAIISSSSVRMTRAATRPRSVEITAAFSALRASSSSMPRKLSPSQMRARTSGAFSPMPPAKTSVSNPPRAAAKEPIHFFA